MFAFSHGTREKIRKKKVLNFWRILFVFCYLWQTNKKENKKKEKKKRKKSKKQYKTVGLGVTGKGVGLSVGFGVGLGVILVGLGVGLGVGLKVGIGVGILLVVDGVSSHGVKVDFLSQYQLLALHVFIITVATNNNLIAIIFSSFNLKLEKVVKK